MNSTEGFEREMPMNHRSNLPLAVSRRLRTKSLAPCAAPRVPNAPKIAAGGLESAAASTKVHNRL